MTATVLRQRSQAHPASSPFSIPPSQNTAPVLEFRCLWTADLKRKAKRWQDGYLRWHTFNNRIMVYDDQRNYIGDTHRSATSRQVEDGEEFTLERSGKMVQCGERLGLTQTDLSELLAKRVAKPVEQEPATRSIGTVRRLKGPRTASPVPHTPVKWQGRALVPQQSPYEIRQAQENTVQEPRNKRQRRDDEHIPLCEIMKPTMNRPNKTGLNNSVPHQPLRLHKVPEAAAAARSSVANMYNNDGQGPSAAKQVVDLTPSSSVELPTRAVRPKAAPATGASHHTRNKIIGESGRLCKSPLHKEYTRSAATSPNLEESTLPRRVSEQHGGKSRLQSSTEAAAAVLSRNAVRSRSTRINAEPKARVRSVESQTITLPKVPPDPPPKPSKRLRPKQKTRHLPSDVTVPSSSPVSTSNHLPPQEVVESPRSEQECNTTSPGSDQRPTPQRKTQELRITARGAKKTLLCQSLAQARPVPPSYQSAVITYPNDRSRSELLLVDKLEVPTSAAEGRVSSNTSPTTQSCEEQAVMCAVIDSAETNLSTGAIQCTHDAGNIAVAPDLGASRPSSNIQPDVAKDSAIKTATINAEIEECQTSKERATTPLRQPSCTHEAVPHQARAPPPAIRAAMPIPLKAGLLAPHTPGTTKNATVRRPFQPLHINPVAPPSKATKDRPAPTRARPPPSRSEPEQRPNVASLVDKPAPAPALVRDESSNLSAMSAQEDANVGPWSREAWDLFAWAPKGSAVGWPELQNEEREAFGS